MPREIKKTVGNKKEKRGSRRARTPREPVFDKELWIPKTILGKKVKAGEITTLEDAIKYGNIMESSIVDFLLPDLKHRIVDIKKTTRVTRAGRHFSFRVTAIVGDSNGHIGIALAKNIERFNAQEKAIQKAKLNMVCVKRGSGSWESNTYDDNSVPYRIVGKCSSLRVELLPAPKGIGLAVSDSIKPVLELAGITNVWSKTRGATDTKLNFVKATIDALHNLSKLKTLSEKKE
jgi:small subunit ribosomal protein S5